MVVKIQPPSASVTRVIDYNDRKVDAGQCECVAVFNTGTSYIAKSYDVLESYARGSVRTRDVVFHASVNPSVTDNMDRHTALLFIRDLMTELGYGKQPVVIFEHNDTGRRHWHIVSVRVDAEGHKINDHYENKRCLDVVRSLQSKYGYTVGRDASEERNPAGYDLTLDLTQRIEKALKYRCTTMAQVKAVLESLGVRMIETVSGTAFQMLDDKGKPKSAAIDAEDLMIPSKDDVEKMVSKNRWSNDDTFRRRSRVNGCVKAALYGARTEDEFRRKLASKGIDVVFSRTDEGKIFGATFIDHTSRSVFKGSELEKGLSASTFNDLFGPENGQEQRGAAASTEQHGQEASKIGEEIALAAIEAAFTASQQREHDINRRKKRKRRV